MKLLGLDIEEKYGIIFEDDEINYKVFYTLETLIQFIKAKLYQQA